jgi:putative transposase
MRKARILGEPGSIYHLTSRILEKRFLMDDEEKERLRRLLWQVADFCGVHLLTHCLMDNHFHVLLEVPVRPGDLDEARIARQLDHLPKSPSAARTPGDQFRCEIEILRRRGATADQIEGFCESFRLRMFDLSRFGQELKQRYTQDYNRRHQRKGPLWEERFKSVLLEATPGVLLKVAAYIDLNPLRAGICKDPKDYRFCGYAGAVAGDAHCLAGLIRLFELMDHKQVWEKGQAISSYRMALFGDARPREGRKGRKARAGLAEEHIEAVLRARGKLPLSEVLIVRMRFFSEGFVLGHKIFVERQAEKIRGKNRMERTITPKAIGDTDEWLMGLFRLPGTQ